MASCTASAAPSRSPVMSRTAATTLGYSVATKVSMSRSAITVTVTPFRRLRTVRRLTGEASLLARRLAPQSERVADRA